MFLNEKIKPFFGSYFAFLNEKKALFLKLCWSLYKKMGVPSSMDTFTSDKRNILDRLLASCGF